MHRLAKLRVICLILSFALLAAFGGCGQAEEEIMPEAEVSAAPSPTPEPTPSPTPEPTPEPVNEDLIEAVAAHDTYIYSDKSTEKPIKLVLKGTLLTAEYIDDMFWFRGELFDGTVGYFYGMELYRADDKDKSSRTSLSGELINAALLDLSEKLPDGKYWNHYNNNNVNSGQETPLLWSNVPCNHASNGYAWCNIYNGKTKNLFNYDTLTQCLGFASYVSDTVFGKDAPFHAFKDPDMLQVGDHIRLHDYDHSMIVVSIDKDGLTVAEVNRSYEDCLISWTTKMTTNDVLGLLWDSEYYSRYPLCPDGEGGYTQWPEYSARNL